MFEYINPKRRPNAKCQMPKGGLILIRCAKCQIFGIWHTKHQKQTLMRCAKCLKIMRCCYSTILNMRAYGQICYNFFDYFIYFSLSVCNAALSLSLSSLVSISPLPPISFSLSYFFSLTLFLSLCISVLSLEIRPFHIDEAKIRRKLWFALTNP